MALSGLINAFDPEVLVIGGALAGGGQAQSDLAVPTGDHDVHGAVPTPAG